MKFKAGDKVKVISDRCECKSYTGKTATVVCVGLGTPSIGIAFNEKIGMHNCDGHCKEGYGYFAHSENLQLIPETQSIHIYRHDNEVIATLKTGKQTTKTAKAKCNPSDEFKIEIGAKLAVARLFNPEVKYIEVETVKAVKEVRRPAKVGEWIKIVDGGGCKATKVGDIACVTSIFGSNDGVEYVTLRGVNGNGWHCRYVVLENYNPKDKPRTIEYLTDDELLTEIKQRMKK